MPPIDRFASGKLTGDSCKTLALQALAGTEPVSVVAERSGVSRPTVYRQMNRANGALDALFTPAACADDKVLFTLPITRRWLEQVALGLTLIGHASFRGVIEFMHDLLGMPLSLDADIDLSSVRVGLHDELFQGSQPVLAGIDVASTYCYLLAPEARRDGDTWAIHLLDLQAQGLNPDYTIADAGTGLRAGPENRVARHAVPR